MIQKLKEIEAALASDPKIFDSAAWNSLRVDYYPPLVERVWMQWDETHRVYLHVIHPTLDECLFHKHRWPAAFKMVSGAYEMGVAYSVGNVDSRTAHALPLAAKFVLSEGTYYEMTDVHGLHYVRPLDEPSLSIMVTGKIYEDAPEEAPHPPLSPLSDARKTEVLDIFRDRICQGSKPGFVSLPMYEVEELNEVIEPFNDREIDLYTCVARVWNKAYLIGLNSGVNAANNNL